jgi:NitT/TauT family transport system permease protein
LSANAARPSIDRGVATTALAIPRPSHLRSRLLAYGVLMLGWQALSTFVFPPFILPSPLVVLQEMADIVASGVLWEHFLTTLIRLAIGFAIAFVLGAAIGIAMGRSAYWREFFGDYIMLTLTTPGLVFALICAMVFGLSPLGPIVAIILTALPHVTVNVHEGVRAIPRELLDMATVYNVNPRARLRHVLIPAVAPYLFTAVRYGFAIAWKITALTELFGSSAGVGFQIRTEYLVFSMRGVLAWTLFLVAFALIIERFVLVRMERDFFRWRRQAFG